MVTISLAFLPFLDLVFIVGFGEVTISLDIVLLVLLILVLLGFKFSISSSLNFKELVLNDSSFFRYLTITSISFIILKYLFAGRSLLSHFINPSSSNFLLPFFGNTHLRWFHLLSL